MKRGKFAVICASSLTLVAILLAGCSGGSKDSNTAGDDPPKDAGPPANYAVASKAASEGAKLTLVKQFDDTITAITGSPDGSTMLVGTRSGLVVRARVVRHRGWTSLDWQGTLLDLSDQTTTDGERGLLNLAFTPDGDHLFVVFTDKTGTVVLRTYRFAVQKLDLIGDVIRVEHPFSGHNGGGLALSKDGRLYISFGDMGSTRPPLAQMPDNWYGKVFSLPTRVAEKGRQVDLSDKSLHLVANGLRNPWRISIDGPSESLWIADVGEARFEEVNKVDLSTTSPVNFGWPYFEGTSKFLDGAPTDLRPTAPLAALPHGPRTCAITGGVVYRGLTIESLSGRYLFGDSCGNDLLQLDTASGHIVGRPAATSGEGMTTIGVGYDGVVFAGGMFGGLYRLDPPGWHVAGVKPRPEQERNSPPTSDQLPVELCQVPEIVSGLARTIDAEPDVAQADVANALDKLRSLERLAPQEQAQQIQIIEKALLSAQGIGERVHWDTSSAEFKDLVAGLSTGTGQWKDFAVSFQELAESLAGSCPSSGG